VYGWHVETPYEQAYISTHTVRPSCSELSRLVRGIADHLHSNELQTILVIPAMMRGSVHKSH